MTSGQAELGSTRLCAEPNSQSHVQAQALPGLSSPVTDNNISERLGGRFSADLEALLNKQSAPKVTELPKIQPQKSNELTIRQFALLRIQSGNVDGAIDFIQHHAPEEMEWLNIQLKCHRIKRPAPELQIQPLQIKVQRMVLIDAEAGRIARAFGQFTLFRAWVYAHQIDDGDGRVERAKLETTWHETAIATSKRHARRLLKEGIEKGYWTYDVRTGRIYLSSQMRVAKRLVNIAIELGYSHLVETNKPGKRRVEVDLSGSLQEASARLYAAWFASKDFEREGVTISREMLCALWSVSIPTLLKWEEIAHVHKHANYAQQNDISIENVPAHAYLTLNRDGSHSAAWRLPNTYTAKDPSIQQHHRTGKAKKIRKAIQREITQAEQRGAIGDAALPRSGKLYFTEHARSKVDPFHACGDYLRKVGRRDGDLKSRRYFYVGKRHGVTIFEPYNLVTNAPETCLFQRLIWRESDEWFEQARTNYSLAVKE